jgi:hypothetical protein
MKHKTQKASTIKKDIPQSFDDIFEFCIKKGLIEKTEFGYYFKPEFFETLKIYED